MGKKVQRIGKNVTPKMGKRKFEILPKTLPNELIVEIAYMKYFTYEKNTLLLRIDVTFFSYDDDEMLLPKGLNEITWHRF